MILFVLVLERASELGVGSWDSPDVLRAFYLHGNRKHGME
jgi:hypothetical protein